MRKLSRREMLKRTAAAGAVATVPPTVLAQTSGAELYVNLTAAQAATLEAFVARLIPSDASGPGALEAGAARYIDGALGNALAASRDSYAAGLAALDTYAERTAGQPFAALRPDVQDALLSALEQNRVAGFTPDSLTFFNLVLGHTLEGTFGDPHYGGNRDFVGWELLGYPGIRLAVAPEEQRMEASLELTRISAYDLPAFDPDTDSATHDDH
jgi:gluconate 2-dehydrogenase gamma chain